MRLATIQTNLGSRAAIFQNGRYIDLRATDPALPASVRELLEEGEAALRAAVDVRAGVFVLANSKGGRVVVPAEKIAYLELGGSEQRQVGFSSR